jgi:predicted dehydrogenase
MGAPAAAAAGAAMLSANEAASYASGRQVAPSNRLRVGLIGCGGMGRGDLATFFLNPEVDCPIVCDVDDAMLAQGVALVKQQRGNTPATVKDFRRVIDRKDVDVVLVATPDHWHALPTVYACQAGKDVYCEKPLAKTIAEGRAMVEAARRHNRVVQMGTQWRSGIHFGAAVEAVRSGRIGKVRQVRCWAFHDWLGDVGHPKDGMPPAGVDYDMWLGPAPKHVFNPNRFHFNFRWFWDYAGGLMTDWGVHLLNIAMWAMGTDPPKHVSSIGGKFALDDNSETPDTQTAIYEFPTYTLTWEHRVGSGLGMNGRTWGIWFTGSDGALIVDDAGWEIIPEPKKKRWEAAKFPGSVDARPAHVRNFLDCVKSRQKPVEDVEFGHFMSGVAHLGNVAYRTGRTITWDAAKERAVGDPAANALITCQYRRPWRLPYLKGA